MQYLGVKCLEASHLTGDRMILTSRDREVVGDIVEQLTWRILFLLLTPESNFSLTAVTMLSFGNIENTISQFAIDSIELAIATDVEVDDASFKVNVDAATSLS
jgi:hypothetical protein